MTIQGTRLPQVQPSLLICAFVFPPWTKTCLFPSSSSSPFVGLLSNHLIGRVCQLSPNVVVCQRADVKGCVESMVWQTEPMSSGAWLTPLVLTANKIDQSFTLGPTPRINLVATPCSSYHSCHRPSLLIPVLSHPLVSMQHESGYKPIHYSRGPHMFTFPGSPSGRPQEIQALIFQASYLSGQPTMVVFQGELYYTRKI